MAGEIVCGQGGSVSLGGTIVKCRGWTIQNKADIADVTVFESAGWHERKKCLFDWIGSFSTISWPGALVGSFVVGSFVDSSETGSKTYSGSCVVEEISPTVDAMGVVEFRATFLGHGPLVIA